MTGNQNFTFSKKDRLRKRSAFIQLSKTGKKVSSRFFIALYRPGYERQTRLGITVSRKVGNAVTRNRIKRVVRENFRLKTKTIPGVWDICIIAKKKAATIDSKLAHASLNTIFRGIR